MRRLLLLLSVFCLLPLAACAPLPFDRAWAYADLRLLDNVDEAATPSTDILAVYTRTIGFDLEIRVDMLDLPLVPDYDLRLSLDTQPGSDPWDLTIDIPATGSARVTPAGSGLTARVIRNPWLDTVTVRLNSRDFSQPFSLNVTSFKTGDPTPADETASVRSDALPPAQKAPLALVFWDVFPATTPAQALRRWDGAHTGPRGERHGLKNILDNVKSSGIPVALLDLKTPASLAALEYMGLKPGIKDLWREGLLILPDVAYAEPSDVALSFSRRAASGFNLPASQFVYSADSSLQSGYPAQFLPMDDPSHMSRSGQMRLIPLPASDASQATRDGPSLEVRKALMAAALSSDPSDLVVLGGDLPYSTWGNGNMATPTFEWLAAHPWIQTLTGEELLTFPIKERPAHEVQPSTASNSLLADLQAAPDNSLTVSAWQTYFTLTAPTNDEKLQALRAGYLGQVTELLAAARWAEHPSAQADCDHDLDNDGQPECVLSDQAYYAILDPSGARLTNLFYLDQAGPHQLVAPSSQFSVGLSDPSEWQPTLGEAADPSVIPGAFSDDINTWTHYTSQISPEGVTFTNPDGSLIKSYCLGESGLQVTYRSFGTVSTRVPLVLDPQAFFFSPSQYQSSLGAGVWTWGLVGGIQVQVQTGAVLTPQTFLDSFSYLSQPEDPDLSYPEGHYLPFPLAVVSLQGSGDFNVLISVK
jgi:hypothetical protein